MNQTIASPLAELALSFSRLRHSACANSQQRMKCTLSALVRSMNIWTYPHIYVHSMASPIIALVYR